MLVCYSLYHGLLNSSRLSGLETKRKSQLSPTNMKPREKKARSRQPSTNKANANNRDVESNRSS